MTKRVQIDDDISISVLSENEEKRMWYARESENLRNWIMREVIKLRIKKVSMRKLVKDLTGQNDIGKANIFALQIIQNTLRHQEAACKSPK